MFLPESDDELEDFVSGSESQNSSDGENDTDLWVLSGSFQTRRFTFVTQQDASWQINKASR